MKTRMLRDLAVSEIEIEGARLPEAVLKLSYR